MALRSSSQEEITLPRRQTSAISAISKVKRSVSGSAVAGLAAQDVEALRIGLHEAIFDAVVDHFDEMPGARWPRVNIAALGAGIPRLPPRRMRDIALARRQGIENRIEVIDGRL